MDEGTLPQKIKIIVLSSLLVLLISSLFFIFTKEIGIFLIFGLFIYLSYFSISNKKANKKSENEFLKIDENWFKSECMLTKEIP